MGYHMFTFTHLLDQYAWSEVHSLIIFSCVLQEILKGSYVKGEISKYHQKSFANVLTTLAKHLCPLFA